MRISDWSSDVCSSDLVARVREDVGPYLQQRLATLADHPLFGEVRGIGLLGAVELVADKASRARFKPEGRAGTICRDHCVKLNVVSRAVRDTMVVSPPLIISRQEIDELVDRLSKAIDLTAKDLGVVRSEEHTSELQSLMRTPYAVFCLKQ